MHIPMGHPIPITVDLFDGVNGLTGQGQGGADLVKVMVLRLGDGKCLDGTDGTFKTYAQLAHPADLMHGMQEVEANARPGLYRKIFSGYAGWSRGHYQATVVDSRQNGQLYVRDFDLGLHALRGLGHSVVYTGSQLKMQLWVEENGQVQADYTALASCRILGPDGEVVTGGNLGALSPTNGVFSVNATIWLQEATNYVFECMAQVDGLGFPLRLGLARP
jgi:hypothetical protein